MRRYDYPRPDAQAWIGLPDQWLGLHARRRDEAVEAAQKQKLPVTLTNFAVAMALLEDWSIPGLAGNPDKWDFDSLDLSIIGWINTLVLADFSVCFLFPKVSPSMSLDGQTEKPETKAPGNSEAKV